MTFVKAVAAEYDLDFIAEEYGLYRATVYS